MRLPPVRARVADPGGDPCRGLSASRRARGPRGGALPRPRGAVLHGLGEALSPLPGGSLGVRGWVGVEVGIGIVFGSFISSVARNPSLTKTLFGYAILGFALTEAIALFALMMAFLILFVF